MANDGKFKVGHEKSGGIKKGQKQRSTQMVANLFDFFESKAEELNESWYALNEREQWDVFIKCLKYMVPSIASVSIEDNKTVRSFRDMIHNIAKSR